MSQQTTKPTGTIKKTKQPLPLSPLLAKAKSKKPLIIYSSSPTDPNCPPSFSLMAQTPSLRWRSKPSIKNCYHDISEEQGGPSGTKKLVDASATDSFSAHRYDRLKASLHSTILPAVVPKDSQAYKKPHKLMMASKSVSAKCPPNQTAGPSSHKGSAQHIPANGKRRYWVPTPTEMAKIGDKIPKAFVKTSLTGRKTVAIPTDTRTWLRGNLTPIESAPSVTDHQERLLRGARLLNKKPKKKGNKNAPPPPQPPTAATSKTPSKSSKNNPPVAPVKSTAKSTKKDPPVAPAKNIAKSTKNDTSSKATAPPKTKKNKDISSKTSGETSKTSRRRKNSSRPLQLDTVYVNTASQLRLHKVESGSTQSLPPPYTPAEGAKPKPAKIMPATVSLGFSAFVECFYCHERYPIDVLRAHQDECCEELLRRRAEEARSPSDIFQEHFENSFHKLNFDGSSCSLIDYDDRPPFIEEGGLFSAIPAKVSSNDAFNETCWYCGWDYHPDIIDRHMVDCAAVPGNVRQTKEGKKLRRLIERKIKAYGRYNPKGKHLWC